VINSFISRKSIKTNQTNIGPAEFNRKNCVYIIYISFVRDPNRTVTDKNAIETYIFAYHHDVILTRFISLDQLPEFIDRKQVNDVTKAQYHAHFSIEMINNIKIMVIYISCLLYVLQ